MIAQTFHPGTRAPQVRMLPERASTAVLAELKDLATSGAQFEVALRRVRFRTGIPAENKDGLLKYLRGVQADLAATLAALEGGEAGRERSPSVPGMDAPLGTPGGRSLPTDRPASDARPPTPQAPPDLMIHK